MSTAVIPAAAGFAPALRRLYLVRFGFAIVWAALLVLAGAQLGAGAGGRGGRSPLLVAAAAVADARAARSSSPSRGVYPTIAVSLVTAIALGTAAAAADVPAVLRVWGAWAIVAGLIQLVVAITRRALGGQWPMMLSGGISVIAGTAFVLMAGAANPSLVNVAGYAALGGIFFLVSALRLGRADTER